MYIDVNQVDGAVLFRVAWLDKFCSDTPTMQEITTTSSARGSRELWLSAAYDDLIQYGVDAVRIMSLAKKLNLSRTSFYWFFRDREELLAAMIELWRDKNTGNFIKQTEAYSESVVEGLLNVFDCWLNPGLFDPLFEFAVRSWALQSAEVAEEVMKADEARLEALGKMFIRYGYKALTADVRARVNYLAQIGYISMNIRESIAERMQRIPEYVEILTGKIPRRHELGRFYARHGYVPDGLNDLVSQNMSRRRLRA